MKRRFQSGFTLVELLVVVGIIAVLIAILLPALNKARRAASDLQCSSNLRQLAMAVLMYANEFNGTLPPWDATNVPTGYTAVEPNASMSQAIAQQYCDSMWTGLLQKYVAVSFQWNDPQKKIAPIFQCPTSRSIIDNTPPYASGNIDQYSLLYERPITYTISFFASDPWRNIGPDGTTAHATAYGWAGPLPSWVKITRWIAPEFIIMTDSAAVRADNQLTVNSTMWPWYFAQYSSMYEVAFRHGNASAQQAFKEGADYPYPTGTANAAFLDGHVEALLPFDFYRQDLSPQNATRAGRMTSYNSTLTN